MDTQASIQLEESTSIVCVTTSTYKRHPGEVNINEDEVILLYIEVFLISKSVSPAELALVKKSTPGLFFWCWSTLAQIILNLRPNFEKFTRIKKLSLRGFSGVLWKAGGPLKVPSDAVSEKSKKWVNFYSQGFAQFSSACWFRPLTWAILIRKLDLDRKSVV